MASYDYCCSVDGHGLRYKEFSVVLLQIFALDDFKDFKLPSSGAVRSFVKPVENGIDSLIFNIPYPKDDSENSSIERFELGGFDFRMSLTDPYPVLLSGHVKVKMSVLFGNTVSLSYRFVFNGSDSLCKMSEPVCTDHIIALLATHLSAEHWSKNKGKSETDINMEVTDFDATKFPINSSGDLSTSPLDLPLNGVGRTFEHVCSRYKSFITKHCTASKKGISREDRKIAGRMMASYSDDSFSDFHYAMVDIWESLMHPVTGEDGTVTDLFANDREPRLSEADIINHIRDFHKPELIGLMTMYPEEWPYRDSEAYDEVCGGNIAIDTDDLVLVNNNVCVVFGTYGRRGAGSPVDWEEHLQEREKYDVSWPEYLLILEMVLAKKFVIGYAKDQLIRATLDVGKEKDSYSDLIAHNASLSIRLSRLELQLDVVKYSRFMSHKVMFDRTTRRLELESDTEVLNSLTELVDNSLHNISDYKAMKSDTFLNFILALVSVASTFQLFFGPAEMPFVEASGFGSKGFSVILLWIVATISAFGILLVCSNMVKRIIKKIKLWIAS